MRKKRGYKMWMVFILVIAILFGLIMIVFPPGNGKLPQFYGENGEMLPDSISEKCYLETDGVRLGMILLSKNKNNPVLLVCGGGPGIPEYLLESMYPSKLADLFTVCFFEYRGTGLSYDPDMHASDMTTERYVADIVTVTDYLKERFSQDKIYILGHSFGSYAAIKTVQQYPENYHAYIAMSQICDQRESEYLAYDYMKGQYELQGNEKMLGKFAQYPVHESEEMLEKYFTSSLRDTAMHDLGVGTTRDMGDVITGIFFPSLRCTAYTWKERIHIWKGKAASAEFPVVADCLRFRALDDVPSLQLPVFFLAGKYDYTCCYALQEQYYEQIEAPAKRFYVFENAAHSPLFEEPDRAGEIMQEILHITENDTCK